MWTYIKSYALLWSLRKSKGIIKLILADDTKQRLVIKSFGEFSLIADLLHRCHAFYDKEKKSIASSWQIRQNRSESEKSAEYEPDTTPIFDGTKLEAIVFEERADLPQIDDKDDLKEIPGIGEATERKLNSLGIFSFHQIASWTESDMDDLRDSLDYIKSRIQLHNWVEHARDLQVKKMKTEVINIQTRES